MDKSRNWCFTLHNPTPEDKDTLLNLDKAKYVKFQLEECPETKRLHYQGLIIFKSMVRLKTVTSLPLSNKAHWEQMKSLKGSLAYCEKDESRVDGPWEAGTPPKKQGQRTDLQEVSELVRDGTNLHQLAQTHPHMIVKYSRGLQTLRSLTSEKRNWVTELYIFVGATGTGKTRLAHEMCEDPYVKPAGDWWDGYDGHEDVIIDDFACDMPITQLLRLADRYPMQVPVKGAMVQFVPKRIFITSNIPYDQWYMNARQEHRDALDRRITQKKIFSNF